MSKTKTKPPRAKQTEVKIKAKSPRPLLAKHLQGLGSSYEKQAATLRDRGVEVSGSYLCMLVRGTRTPSVDLARQMAAALGVDITVIIGE